MKPSDYKISLDIHELQSQYSLSMRKGDTARVIYITLREGGVPYEISTDCFAVLSGRKPDGTVLENNCVIKGNTIIYAITPQTTSASGLVDCEIKLYGVDNGLICSARFSIIVDKRVAGDEEVESSSEFTALTNLYTEARNAENERVVAESKRETDTAEAIKNANEASKKANDIADTLQTKLDNDEFKGEKGDTPETDQKYNPTSENAQSGVAVEEGIEEAIAGLPLSTVYRFNIAELSKITIPNSKLKALDFEIVEQSENAKPQLVIQYTVLTAIHNLDTGEITKLIDIPAQYDKRNELLGNSFNNYYDYSNPCIYNEIFGKTPITFSMIGEILVEEGYCSKQSNSVVSMGNTAAISGCRVIGLVASMKLTFESAEIRSAVRQQYIDTIFSTNTHIGIKYTKPASIVDAPVLIEQTSLEDTLYNAYGVDKEEYPCVFIVYSSGSTSYTSVSFAKSYKTDGVRVYYYNALSGITYNGVPTSNDNETVVNYATTNVTSIEAKADGWFCSTTKETVHSNVDCTNCNATYISLVE